MTDAMMTNHDPQSEADRFLKFSTIGAISAVGVLAIAAFRPADVASPMRGLVLLVGFINLLMIVMFIRSLYVMFRTRNADEYVRGLWNAGTSTAFIAVTLWSVSRAVLFGAARVASRYYDSPALQQVLDAKPHIFAITIIAFFTAVLVQRNRSA